MTQIRKSEPMSALGALLGGNCVGGSPSSTMPRRKRQKRQRSLQKAAIALGCCCIASTIVSFAAFLVLFPPPGRNYWSSNYWRASHHTNSEIARLQKHFPIHVASDLEKISHPGFLLSDSKRLAVVLDGFDVQKDLQVPRFWNPPAYGDAGVRNFLGNAGNFVISKEEADAIGSMYNGKETIFVAVASYRDPECLSTVEDIFRRAKHPERIRVAIVDQRAKGGVDPICSRPLESCEQDPNQVLCKYGYLIDAMEYEAQLMVGPTLARHLAYRMYRGEYFAMQVDSHVRFVANWDEDIIDQWKSTGNEMGVISTYLSDTAKSIDPNTHKSLRETRSIMCKAEYEWKGESKEHIKYSIQPTNKPRIKSTPMLHPFWAAGFSFARGHFVLQVPYDAWLPFVFQGEEISMTVRAFSYGYDFYAPLRNVAYHIYAVQANQQVRSNVKMFTENSALFPGAKDQAYHRLNGIIGVGKTSIEFNHMDEDIYGLGSVRSRETYYRTFGIHTERSEMELGLCTFVQGTGMSMSMHQLFSPSLRYDGMGIDYSRIELEYEEQEVVDSPVDPAELVSLREHLRKQSSTQ